MLLNHERRTPDDWDDAIPSLCPDCRVALIARRGPVVVWHWAHRAQAHGGGGDGCRHEESGWHLTWKKVYHQWPGWEVEVPCTLGGETYRLDAANLARGKVREFVHSVADNYVAKHLALKGSGLDVLWIFDGEEFGAARQRYIRGGGLKHLLKPRARWLHSHLGGLVHLDSQLWREWKADCWYPVEHGHPVTLCEAYERLRQRHGIGAETELVVPARPRWPEQELTQ